MDPNGLRPATAAFAQPPVMAPPPPAPMRHSSSGGSAGGSIWGDPFFYLLAVGTLLTIIFAFMPLLDMFKVGNIGAQLERLQGDRMTAGPSGRGEGDSAERERLQKQIGDARISVQANRYWYAWFMMFAFFFVAAGSLGWIVSAAGGARRVVGSVLLCTEVGIVVIMYMIMGTVPRF
jgi:hypothetical protein